MGRCREQTAGTYGKAVTRSAMVKACSRPRTPCPVQDGGESRSGKKILRRKACRFESDLGHQFKSRPCLDRGGFFFCEDMASALVAPLRNGIPFAPLDFIYGPPRSLASEVLSPVIALLSIIWPPRRRPRLP